MRNVPKWAKGNGFAKRFFKWLRRKNQGALLTEDAVFTKVSNQEFTFVYRGVNMRNSSSRLYQGMDFVGIFNQKTFEFTDVSYSLRALLNIPEGRTFRFQRGACTVWNVRFRNMHKRNWTKKGKRFQLPQWNGQHLRGNTER